MAPIPAISRPEFMSRSRSAPRIVTRRDDDPLSNLHSAPPARGGADSHMAEGARMAVALAVEQQMWNPRAWPMTREAWERLDADAARLGAQVVANDGYVTGHLDGDAEAPTFIPNVVGQQLLRQLDNVREMLARGVILDDPGVAVIGRQVTLVEADGRTSTYALVIPGEGDPRSGLVSVDSPVGSALLGRRIGDEVNIQAPAGSWTATVSRIE
jgi:transcription elongation GreA/GreB family factor